MEFLINMNKPTGKAHLWENQDSYCKMYSTGGMRKTKYKVYQDHQEREVCVMCLNNKKQHLNERGNDV